MKYIEDFIRYLLYEKRYSSHTVKSYSTDLKQFFRYAVSCNKGICMTVVDHRLIRSWVADLVENRISARSVHRKISALRSFYKYLLKEGVVQINPVERVLKPKQKKSLPRFVSEDRLNELLDNQDFGTDYTGLRNRMMIEMFYLTGMRLSELINLSDGQVDLDQLNLKVTGKRNKERLIPISKQFAVAIRDYLEERNKATGDNRDDYFFLTGKGKKLYPRLVYRVVRAYLELVTTIDKKSPHALRHSFATHLLNRGADLNAVKELLGHANLGATQVYTHNTFEKLKKIYQKAHPRA